jgi:hypothetical protein
MMPLLAFKREDPTRGDVKIVERLRDTARRHKIRCPSCGWQPGESARWFCADTDAPEYFSPGCGTAWNTFTTRGLCPGCSQQWTWTACLQCGSWSKHEEWYVPEDDAAAP